MKNYSSNRAQKGKTAYRTPSLYKANKSMKSADLSARTRLFGGQIKSLRNVQNLYGPQK